MKGLILIRPKFLKFISRDFARAMALFPFILVQNEGLAKNEILMHHERIHLRQQLELGIIFFYILYLGEYLLRRLQFKTHYTAYRHISFEREAYANEKNMNYLKERSLWRFLKYW